MEQNKEPESDQYIYVDLMYTKTNTAVWWESRWPIQQTVPGQMDTPREKNEPNPYLTPILDELKI